MAIQAIATTYMHKDAPKTREVEGQTYNVFKTIHLGPKPKGEGSIQINLHVVPGSVVDQSLTVFQQDLANNAEAGTKKKVRLLIQGTDGTLNVKADYVMGGGASQDGKQLTQGVVQRINSIDLICTSARQTVLDARAEPEQFTVTMIADCQGDAWTTILKTGDGLQAPLQPGQKDAYHLRLLPENAAVKDVLHGIGDPKANDYIPPESGLFFLSGSLVRDSKAAQPMTVKKDGEQKDAFPEWDRIALHVTSAFPIEVQDMKSQKESNSTVAMAKPDTSYFDSVTSGESETAEVNFGDEVESLFD
ncbi:hypothetical protein N8608_02140 [bacterium]|nr:hypothetical protein [bacterium]